MRFYTKLDSPGHISIFLKLIFMSPSDLYDLNKVHGRYQHSLTGSDQKQIVNLFWTL